MTARRRPPRSERRLEASLSRGDEKALERVWREHSSTVLGYLTGVLGDRALAEDVRQQVFTEVWQRAQQYDPRRASPSTWIFTIARSRAVDELRRRKPEPRDPGSAPGIPDPNTDRSPDALLERWSLAQLMRKLRAEEVLVLRLRFYGGLSQSEIAEATGLPLGTVKMRMVQALDHLRELIDAELGEHATAVAPVDDGASPVPSALRSEGLEA